MNENIDMNEIDAAEIQAYVDGQLDAARRARVETAMAADPMLAAAHERESRLRARVHAAFAPVLDEPVPVRFDALLRGDAPQTSNAAADGAATVVAMPAPNQQAASYGRRSGHGPGHRSLQLYALAASVALLAFSAMWWMRDPRGVWDGDTLVAQGTLARGLDNMLASATAESDRGEGNSGEGDALRIGLTFRDRSGRICRSFVTSGEAAVSGLACRDGSQWQLQTISAVGPEAQGELRRASVQIAPEVMAAIDARLSGVVFDAQQEREARAAGWR